MGHHLNHNDALISIIQFLNHVRLTRHLDLDIQYGFDQIF